MRGDEAVGQVCIMAGSLGKTPSGMDRAFLLGAQARVGR